jgi:Dolichyl-phosphate-mannose--protein O-mannosyl transferase
MYRRWVYALLVGVILLVYLSTLHRYGTAIPAAMPPEEISFAGLSRSIAEGKGIVFAIPSEIVPSPAETPRPFLMPVVSYALALSGWGSILGFDLLPLRWFNRILGVLNLLLLILLARRWGVPRGLALLAAFWTSMDIAYQMVSNMVRSDMFSLFGILLGLWAFTQGQQRGGARWWAASGACLALALFAHFWQGFYITAWLALALLWNRRWKGLAAFLIPIVAAGLLWLLFVLQDWSWFLFLSRLMVLDKTPPGWPTLVWLSGVHVITNLLGIYPSSGPSGSPCSQCWRGHGFAGTSTCPSGSGDCSGWLMGPPTSTPIPGMWAGSRPLGILLWLFSDPRLCSPWPGAGRCAS